MSTSIYCSDNVCVFMNYILCHTFYNASCFRARSEFIKVFKILLWLAVVFLPFRRSNSGNLVCAYRLDGGRESKFQDCVVLSLAK